MDLTEATSLLSLQGPQSASLLAKLGASGVRELEELQLAEVEIAGRRLVAIKHSRTGEEGFDLFSANDGIAPVFKALLDAGVKPFGLTALNLLRLEAGLCLAGTDIDPTTTPIEAGLSWIIAKKYRTPGVTAVFPGQHRILNEINAGTTRVRVGVRSRGRGLLRGGERLRDVDGQIVGHITSGSFGASINAPIAMGYVERREAATGNVLSVTIREREQPADIVALPFVPHRYHRI